MNDIYTYSAIVIMAVITYLIRIVPLAIFRKPIKNRFFRSFLTYAPYVTLSVLTFPAIFTSTGSFETALVGTIVAFGCSVLNCSLLVTVLGSCATVYMLQLIF